MIIFIQGRQWGKTEMFRRLVEAWKKENPEKKIFVLPLRSVDAQQR